MTITSADMDAVRSAALEMVVSPDKFKECLIGTCLPTLDIINAMRVALLRKKRISKGGAFAIAMKYRPEYMNERDSIQAVADQIFEEAAFLVTRAHLKNDPKGVAFLMMLSDTSATLLFEIGALLDPPIKCLGCGTLTHSRCDRCLGVAYCSKYCANHASQPHQCHRSDKRKLFIQRLHALSVTISTPILIRDGVKRKPNNNDKNKTENQGQSEGESQQQQQQQDR